MARISTYGQDGTLNKLDKVIGTDSETGATKNYSIDSMLGLVNEDDLVDRPDGGAFAFKSYEAGSTNPQGIINLNAGLASQANFSAVNQIYISVLDKSGLSVSEYLENADNDFIKISKRDNINQFGIYEVTAIIDHDGGAYKKLSVTPRGTNGTLNPNDSYFVSNYSALYDQDFSDDSITEFGDVSNTFFAGTGITELTNAGSGQIITGVERTSLTNFTDNGLIHADVVNNVTSTAIDVPLSAAQGKVLKDLIDSINSLLEVDTEDAPALDTLREIVNFCQINASTLSSLGIGSITGLQAALDLKQNTEAGKGLSANDFTLALKNKLDSIAENAEVNVNADWTASTGDAQILNKPTDLTNLGIHDVTELRDVTSAGSGAIITSSERIKLTNIDVDATARTVTDGTDSITVPPDNAEQNVQANWDESDSNSDAFILNKPALAPSNAEQNVQANWNESDSTSDAFIQNKPTIPVDTNTTYDLTVQDSGDNAIIRLTDSSSANDDVTIVAGNNVTLTPNSSNLTIDIDLSTGAVADGATTLTTGDQVFDYLANFARTNVEETFSDNVIIQGDLTVSGTTTTVNTTELNIGDSLITLNSDLDSSTAPSENSGIEINRGSSSDAALIWNESADKWQISSDSSTYNDISIVDTVSDLSDTSISSLANDQVLKYNSTTAKWENQAEGGSIDGTGVANKVAIWSDIDTLTNDTDLHWDATNDRLGIGTPNPSEKLHINGNIRVSHGSKLYTNGTITIAADDNGSGAGNILFENGGTERMRIASNGNVGIGTNNPSVPLHVSGFARLGNIQLKGSNSARSIYAIDNVDLLLGTNNTEKMRITSDGKVGIGNDQPEVSLDLGNNTDALQLPAGDNTARSNISNPFGGMIRYNTTDNQFEGYSGVGAAGSWGAIGGSSGGSGEIVKSTFSATGSASFSLPDTIVDIDNVNVYVSGVYQYPSNYTVSGNTVTFNPSSIPAAGTDNVHIRHNVAVTTLTEGAAFSTSGSLVGDGTTATFALGGSPRSSDHAMVFLEGVYQEKENYSISGSNITFNTPPPNGYSIEVKYVTGVLDLTDVGEVVLDELTGDGTATYALSAAPQSENYTNVYIEGVYQEKGTYGVSGANITFSSNVPTGYSIEVSTMRTIPSSSVTQTTFVTDTFTANGSTNNFTLVNGSPSSKSLTMVFIQGVYQAKSNYNLVSGEIQFTAGTPSIDDVIEVISISAVNMAGSPVTSVNGEVGAVTVASKHNVSVISSDTTAVANTLYVLTGNLNLTLPASPAMGDSIKISNRSGITTCQLLRNGNNILGAAADLTLDTASASFELVYTDAANGWVIIGQ